MQIIATIKTCYPGKFGVPRQSGMVPAAQGQIIFEPTFRQADALRGVEGFSHIWLLWLFHEHIGQEWHTTVRPPRLGGNTRMGVFATRAPFRPNPIGMSVVRLESIDYEATNGPVLYVSGVDMINNTPIIDIKPYVPLADCVAEASAGFSAMPQQRLHVVFESTVTQELGAEQLEILEQSLACDPRPSYQDDKERIYGMEFAGKTVKFRVAGSCLHVLSLE